MLFAYRAGKNRISRKALAKLRSAEIGAGIGTPLSDRPASEYRISGDREHRVEEREQVKMERMIQPQFAAAHPEPTRRMILEYLERYLAAAERIPGGLGHTWIELRKHFRIEELKNLEEP